MRKSLLLAVLALAVASCMTEGHRKIRRSPQAVTAERKYALERFERIAVVGDLEVRYVQGSEHTATVTTPAGAERRLDIRVKGRTLNIKMNERGFSLAKEGRRPVVEISSPDLVAVSVTGSGDFKARGRVDTDNLQLKVFGSGEMEFPDIICDTLVCEVAGSGEIEAGRVQAGTAMLKIAGSGEMDIHFEQCGTVVSKVAGSGEIELSGTVGQHTERVAGSGTIDISKLITK